MSLFFCYASLNPAEKPPILGISPCLCVQQRLVYSAGVKPVEIKVCIMRVDRKLSLPVR